MVAWRVCRLCFIAFLLGLPISPSWADDRVATWLTQLGHASPRVRSETLERIGAFASPDQETRDRIQPLLHDPDPNVAAAAAAAFLGLGGDREIVRKQLDRGSLERRAALAVVLLATDGSDDRALSVFVDGVAEGESVTWKATGFSNSVIDRMAEMILKRVASTELEPMPATVGDSGQLDGVATTQPYWRLWSEPFRPRPAYWRKIDTFPVILPARLPQLMTLSRSNDPYNRAAATEMLVEHFYREPLVQREFRDRLTETVGEQQLLMAIGILRSEPEDAKAGVLVRWALNNWGPEKTDSDPSERARILLRQYDLPSVPLLPKLIDGLLASEGTARNRQRCLDLLLESGPSVMEPFLARWEDPAREPVVSDDAWPDLYMLLAARGEHAAAAIPLLTRRYEQGDILAMFALASAARDAPLPEPLSVILASGTEMERKWLISALGAYPPRRPDVRAQVLRWLSKSLPDQHGSDLMVSLALSHHLGGSKAEVSRRLVNEFNELGNEVVNIRFNVRAVLNGLGADAADVVLQSPALQKLPDLEFYAADAINALVAGGERSVPRLVLFLENDHPDVRCCACVALAKIGPEAQAAVPALIRRLDDDAIAASTSRDSVCMNAINALGAIGPAARPGLAPLLALLGKPRPPRARILSALSRIAGPDDRGLLENIRPYLVDSELSVQAEAVLAFIRIAPDDRETEQAARDYLRRLQLHRQWSFDPSLQMIQLCASLEEHPTLVTRLAATLEQQLAAPLLDSDESREALARLLEQVRPLSPAATDPPRKP